MRYNALIICRRRKLLMRVSSCVSLHSKTSKELTAGNLHCLVGTTIIKMQQLGFKKISSNGCQYQNYHWDQARWRRCKEGVIMYTVHGFTCHAFASRLIDTMMIFGQN
jgi:hypothetical protein